MRVPVLVPAGGSSTIYIASTPGPSPGMARVTGDIISESGRPRDSGAILGYIDIYVPWSDGAVRARARGRLGRLGRRLTQPKRTVIIRTDLIAPWLQPSPT